MSNLRYISPFFIVTRLAESVSFYADKLGFEVQYTGSGVNPYFAIVARDNVSIMLKAITADVPPAPNPTRHEWARWDAFIHTAEPDALFEEYCAAGIIFRQSLQEDDDGLYGFEVADADGYVLFFGRPKQ
jgi:catechol 2,3-dioxygenase-like lactoylglutathione lyase family enzyme